MLIVVKDRDRHPLAQTVLDLETFRRLDVFEVDGPEGRLQRRDHADEKVRVFGVDLDVEHIDAGEFLEQDRLAFHHRLAREGADVAQAEHGRSVRDHGDQIASGGEVASGLGIGHDGLAGGRHAGRIGERQVALGGHALGRLDGELPRPRKAMIIERRLNEILVHELPFRMRSGIFPESVERGRTLPCSRAGVNLGPHSLAPERPVW